MELSGRLVKGALTCYYSLIILIINYLRQEDINYPLGKASVTDCNRKRCTLYSHTGSTLLYYVSRRKTSLLSQQPASQKKCCSSTNEKLGLPELLLFLQ